MRGCPFPSPSCKLIHLVHVFEYILLSYISIILWSNFILLYSQRNSFISQKQSFYTKDKRFSIRIHFTVTEILVNINAADFIFLNPTHKTLEVCLAISSALRQRPQIEHTHYVGQLVSKIMKVLKLSVDHRRKKFLITDIRNVSHWSIGNGKTSRQSISSQT